MRIAVVGAGAIGLYFGARLQQGGEDVHFLLRRDYDAVIKNGLIIESCKGNFSLGQVQGYRSPQEIGPVDLVLIGLKAFANDRYQPLIEPLIGPKTLLLTLQNGLGNEDRLATLFGAEKIVGGIAFICSYRGEPGTVHHTGGGHIQIAEYTRRGITPRLTELEAMFERCQIPCKAQADIHRMRWEKLVWNIPFNGLCALTGKTTDALLTHPPSRALIIGMMQEVVNAGNAQGLMEPISDSFVDQMINVTEPMGAYKPSMMIDRLEGRPLELAAIYGEPLHRAAEAGVAMPRTAMLQTLLDLDEEH